MFVMDSDPRQEGFDNGRHRWGDPDVAVIGAGPVGCVTALAFARQGARVLLLEGNPRSALRLAGECLHPAGVQVLEDLGLDHVVRAGYAGHGFAVFPEDGSPPILLQYPEGTAGLTCEHYHLVTELRQAAAEHPNINLSPGAQALAIDGQHLHFETEHRHQSVHAELIVGADGRSSLARKCLGLEDRRSYVSAMAGVLVEDVEMEHDGFGQVFLGGPGPALACRIGPQRLRLFLDLPPGTIDKNVQAVASAFGPVLPPSWREAFRRALEERPVVWASNQWRSRLEFGRPGLALVGDAVGHYHPLTAVGLTLGFLDAACLAGSKNFAEYRRQRSAKSSVAELLAYALYKAFTHDDPGTLALRAAIFQTWRNYPAECRRTMRLLSADETDVVHFNRAFLRVLAQAGQQVLHDSLFTGRWMQTARILGNLARWLRWLAVSASGGSRRKGGMKPKEIEKIVTS
jgi:2-polyprenyl-6-methoxyphenol hydroxylase-like FAD-dependent oxidoreductase